MKAVDASGYCLRQNALPLMSTDVVFSAKLAMIRAPFVLVLEISSS